MKRIRKWNVLENNIQLKILKITIYKDEIEINHKQLYIINK